MHCTFRFALTVVVGLALHVSQVPFAAAQGQATPGKAASPKKPAAKAPAKIDAGKGQPKAPAKSSVAEPSPKATLPIDPMDWPNWKGPEQNRISRETGLVDSWEIDGENMLWKNDQVGGISNPIILRGKLYTIVRDKPDTPQEREKVVCIDANTGKILWENAFNVFLSDVPAERVGWSSCVGDPATGRIYAMGVCGYFQCLDGDTGKTIWVHSLNEESGLLSTYGGRTNIPVLFDDLVITSSVTTGWGDVARPAHRYLAFKKDTGEPVWVSGTKLLPEDTTYSTPTAAVTGGQAALVFGSGDGGVWALQPRTGKPIWNFQLSRRGINVSPIVRGNTVFMAHAEENTKGSSMGAIVALKADGKGDVTDSAEVWRADGMVGKTSLLEVDGRLYGCDDGGKLYVLDAKTGEPICKPVKLIGTIVRSSPIYADGKIYVCSTSAWHVFEPTANGVKMVNKLRLPETDEVAGSIAISHGKIYLPTVGNIYCIGKADVKPAIEPQPEAPKESAVGDDPEPAWLQITPVEVLLKPGEKCRFTARLFNSRGQFLKTSPATWELKGPGEISAEGEYVAASAPAHTATIVIAKVGELTRTARIRVVPPLPWKFDFSDGEIPVTWIGAPYRHQIREVDGDKVMVKITTIPKGTRSQSWMGPTDLHDYTIQADVRGANTNNKLPDMGLIAQRYTLDLMGASQQLQIRSWVPQLHRFSHSVKYEWKPNVWYTLKFRAAVENGQAVLKGKVWPRGEKEPDAWTIEAVDATPNVVGSPGLFGNASDSEITIDNVIVTPNSNS